MSKKLLIITLVVLVSSVAVAGDIFKTLDVDNSGSISQAEAVTLPSLADQLKALDTNKNGELNTEEFAKYEVKEAE
jgi:Ca2+-binding EF-hand superfamily protein